MNKSFFNQKNVSSAIDKKRKLVIEKINKSAILGMDIPIYSTIKSQNANRAWLSSGKFKWTFDNTGSNYLDDFGSCQSIHVLSKCDNFILLGKEILGTRY